MDFLVFGVGAVGSVIGGFHHLAGHKVWLHGRRVDIDALNGYIVRLAERREIEVPANRLLTALIKSLAEKNHDFGQH